MIRNTLKLFAVAAIAFAVASCGSKKQQNEDAIDFITELYNDYVFGTKDISSLEDHFTRHMIEQMILIGYDGYPNYRIFDLGFQDGPDYPTISKLLEVNALGYDWYEVKFIDTDYEGVKNIRAICVDGKVMLDGIEEIYNSAWGN